MWHSARQSKAFKFNESNFREREKPQVIQLTCGNFRRDVAGYFLFFPIAPPQDGAPQEQGKVRTSLSKL
jgi:hypothetical protein